MKTINPLALTDKAIKTIIMALRSTIRVRNKEVDCLYMKKIIARLELQTAPKVEKKKPVRKRKTRG